MVISYLPHTRQSDVSVLNWNRNSVRHVTLNKRVSGSGKHLPVESDCQPYTDCCFFLSILIFKNYLENDQLYRCLECGAKISEGINLKEISDL